jgi:hypothetical protein
MAVKSALSTRAEILDERLKQTQVGYQRVLSKKDGFAFIAIVLT